MSFSSSKIKRLSTKSYYFLSNLYKLHPRDIRVSSIGSDKMGSWYRHPLRGNWPGPAAWFQWLPAGWRLLKLSWPVGNHNRGGQNSQDSNGYLPAGSGHPAVSIPGSVLDKEETPIPGTRR